ncbi:sulfurtransferase/chromate resistance protein [Rhodobacteraceae bacterium N5(2021)]|uniref:Sulfurtransferase/chromate resistance protein n=1 Tax=Gymnodinialimonas phycosphaerae TaxID=2841589 RepID=A0A975YG39_9RHOB|nr:sulfurtransferase/chromate resistance protein [Gymnodinialimonas phycosphaerae]MBY4891243.1 sulfurtransferase/chromate resistance protein [Gymnodinialimonas phycosphaerae]
MASYNEISTPTLARLIGTPDCPVLLDVRLDDDVDDDPRLIPGAVRHPFADVVDLVPALAGRSVVVYCQKGLKISQGAAALLRAAGIRAEVLEGGHVAWRDAGLPMVPLEKLPPRDPQGRTRWVTRHRPKIDRIACPWLIRRFIDPDAQFLFVAPSQVTNVAERFSATPFDITDTFWSHRGGACTFDTMIAELGLSSPALERLATIVRGADTNAHDLAPEAAGLLAASLGLSRMFRDDLEQLEAGMTLYDAFFRWARDAVDGGHDWPGTPGSRIGKGA